MSIVLLPSLIVCWLGGVLLRNARLGLSGPLESAEPMSSAIATGETISRPTSNLLRRRVCRSFSSNQRIAALMPLGAQERDERLLEVLAVGGPAGGLQLRCRPAEEHLAVGEDEDTVGVALGLGDVVRREEHRGAALRQRREKAPQPL